LIWLVDGALQLQPFMFRRSFVTQIIAPNAVNQPRLIAAPIRLMAYLIEPRVAWVNLLAVTIQVLIGVGLIYRPTVKEALLTSFGWALSIWWIGEGLGGTDPETRKVREQVCARRAARTPFARNSRPSRPAC
jgi:hypothetical protein